MHWSMKRNIQIVTFLVFAIPGFASDSVSSKAAPKLASIAQIMPEAEFDVIIQFAKSPGRAEQEFLTMHGLKLRKLLPVFNRAAYSLPAKKLGVVCESSLIERVSFDSDVRATMATVALLQSRSED